MRRALRALILASIFGFPLLLVAAADIFLVPAAESRLEHRARAATKSASVEARVGTFPVAGRVLALGEVASVDLTWFGVEVGALQATSLELHLRGVAFDRGSLFGGEARITGVESGNVRMLIAPSQLSRLLQGTVSVEQGKVRLRLNSETSFDVQVSATNRALVLSSGNIAPVTAEFGADDIPCAPTVTIQATGLVLECSFRGLPPSLRDGFPAA